MAFTDRHSGLWLPPDQMRQLGPACDDVIRANRARTATAFGLDPDRVVFMRQVHGADVRRVSEPFGSDPPPTDGMCTDRPGLALAVLVADCGPVLLADPVAAVVGCAHAGRTGTKAGVVAETVWAMVRCGADPARMTALVGPTVCGHCYEVPLELREEMAADWPAARAVTRTGTPSIDLRAAIRAQLLASGVQDIRHDQRCTVESPELFSYRREGPTGDFAGYVWLEPEPG
ncbi:peptidoglycan editing factor PgeF [Streptomyces sp. CA-250714]|uniref:peptidoglycan editing factor PgeF n=1 Tax=Streptomyces sp. CA-250714 TaxID=3240060 RepID=UPI003D943FA0